MVTPLSCCVSYGCLLDIIADRVVQTISGYGVQTAVSLLYSCLRADCIAEPVDTDGETDAVAFGCISVKLFINGTEAIPGAEHGKLVSYGFDPLPVNSTLEFTDIKSFYTHRNQTFL